MQQKKQMEEMHRVRDANQIGTSPNGIGKGYGMQIANMQEREQIKSSFASKQYQNAFDSNSREHMIARAQNQMNDPTMNQERVNSRVQAQHDYKMKINDEHGRQLRNQVQADQMNKHAMQNALKMNDMSEAERQRNYNAMMTQKEN